MDFQLKLKRILICCPNLLEEPFIEFIRAAFGILELVNDDNFTRANNHLNNNQANFGVRDSYLTMHVLLGFGNLCRELDRDTDC